MKKADYDIIAAYYDKVIGKGYETNDYIRKKINRYNKNVKTVLELGCGTGSNLLHFDKDIAITGIDISVEMLKIAKNKLPGCKFYQQDIRTFSLNKKFDLIICLYDTLNHVLLFSDWKKIFKNADKHLNDKGLFIFDINTLAKLEYISAVSPFMHEFDSNYLIVNVKKIFRNTFNWNLKIFENKRHNMFSLLEQNIKESSFETDKISNELLKYFNIKRIDDENGRKVKYDNERVFFVCQKKW
ncbi:MAG: class I SAM-dependent methyltransferase [Ignavibacteria bacterium]|nr:class I SAM-dependent methyltransferase [Ignavibacteria bacterium]